MLLLKTLRFFLILSIFSVYTYAAETTTISSIKKRAQQDILFNRHYPIIGDRASTVGHLKVNFDKMSGGQANDVFMANSLSLGLGERVEIGILPWTMINENKDLIDYSFVFKLNFYKSSQVQWSSGFSYFKNKDILYEGNENKETYAYNYSGQHYSSNSYFYLSFNYTPQEKKYNLGVTLKRTILRSKTNFQSNINYMTNSDKENPEYAEMEITQNDQDELIENYLAIDFNMYTTKDYWLGFALGRSALQSPLNAKSANRDENEKARLNAGISLIKRGTLWKFNDPRVSIVYYEASSFQTNLAFNF